jgi:hypothetical protein
MSSRRKKVPAPGTWQEKKLQLSVSKANPFVFCVIKDLAFSRMILNHLTGFRLSTEDASFSLTSQNETVETSEAGETKIS